MDVYPYMCIQIIIIMILFLLLYTTQNKPAKKSSGFACDLLPPSLTLPRIEGILSNTVFRNYLDWFFFLYDPSPQPLSVIMLFI